MLIETEKSNVKGVTLIELMIGLAIVALTLALGMPSFGQWIQNGRLRNAAESILGGVQLARSEAVKRNTRVKFVLGSGSAWNVGCVTVTASCPASIQSRATGDGSTSAVTVTPADGDTIAFDGLGRMIDPVPAAGTATTIDVDLSSTVTAAADTRDLRITVDVGGIVRMCDPNVSDTSDARKC